MLSEKDVQVQALEGVRILGCVSGIAGPAICRMLAWHGAEAITVETAAYSRAAWRYRHNRPGFPPGWRYLEGWRGVRSITVNLKHPKGPSLLKEVIEISDVFVDNFREDFDRKYGLEYSSLKERRPSLVRVRMPAFGCTGPKAGYVSWGLSMAAFTGLTYLWNHADTATPVGCQTVYPDWVAAQIGTCAVLAALLDRQDTGVGTFIDLSQAEDMIYLLGVSFLERLVNGTRVRPVGNRPVYGAPAGCFRCKGDDRWCVIVVRDDHEWQALCEAMACRELVDDPRFCDVAKRRQHKVELQQMVEQWTSSLDAHDIMAQLQAMGVPCGVVQDGKDLCEDVHLRERGFIDKVFQPLVGAEMFYPGLPFRFSETSGNSCQAARDRGQDNEYVFGELLGYSKEKIVSLVQQGVLV